MIDKYIRSEENKGAVINTDRAALNAYKQRKKLAAKQTEEIENLKAQINHINTSLDEIKKLLLGK